MSLLVPELHEFWATVRQRVERRDGPTSGQISIGAVAPPARLVLEALLRRPLRTTVKLTELELSLHRLGIGATLTESLHRLGHPPATEPARQRQARRAATEARNAARATVANWPEPWAADWIVRVLRSGALGGLDRAAATTFVGEVRRVLDRLDAPPPDRSQPPRSRTDLSAELFGDAHRLDTGTRLEAAVTRALALRHELADRRELWSVAGAQLDLTSAPVLVWNLPLVAGRGLGPLVSHATALGVPQHLSQLALRRHPLQPVPGADVLLVENPRVVEAAAQRQFPGAVACSGGNPSGAVQLLVAQLLTGGAAVRYHGDFDTAGLAICGRLQVAGAIPWRMDVADYEQALATAAQAGVSLPLDEGRVPSTPWSPPLQDTFARHRRVIHEERLLDLLLR